MKVTDACRMVVAAGLAWYAMTLENVKIAVPHLRFAALVKHVRQGYPAVIVGIVRYAVPQTDCVAPRKLVRQD